MWLSVCPAQRRGIDRRKVTSVIRMTQKLGWESVTNEQKSDREKNRTVRARQRAIGRELRRIYDEVVKEPVPDEFLGLLQKMDEQDEEKVGKVERDTE